MKYRDPDTGRFITKERWEILQEMIMEQSEEWDMQKFEYLVDDDDGEEYMGEQ